MKEKRFFILHILIILGLFLLQSQGFCFELDNSIDDEINKTYNASELEQFLPQLPQGIEPNERPNQQPKSTITKTQKPNDDFTAVKIRRGTKFRTTSNTWASDSAKVGNQVSFTTLKPVTKRYITIPAGSTLRGRIVDAHLPQYAGNGGLVKIEIESITINGANRFADGKVTKANGKKIFFNNIKGKRKYVASMGKTVKKSHKFFQKSMKKTSQFASDGATVILSPFTFVGGLFGYLGGIVVSPIVALNSKGERMSLPPDTIYEIKLTKDLYIYD